MIRPCSNIASESFALQLALTPSWHSTRLAYHGHWTPLCTQRPMLVDSRLSCEGSFVGSLSITARRKLILAILLAVFAGSSSCWTRRSMHSSIPSRTSSINHQQPSRPHELRVQPYLLLNIK
ncbi:hypothetical protein BDW69DRAFT_170780 [Aspergillus filifer]